MTYSVISICQQCQSPVHFEHLKDINITTYNLLLNSFGDSIDEMKELEPIPSLFPKSREVYYYKAMEQSLNPSVMDYQKNFDMDYPISYNETPNIYKKVDSIHFFDTSTLHLSTIHSLNDLSNNREILSDKQYMLEHLFDIMSSFSNISHPICSECAETLLDTMSKHLHYSKKERDAYIEFLNHINDDIPNEDEIEEMELEIQDNLKKKIIALETINQLKEEQAKIEKEIEYLEKESLSLNNKEEIFWRKRNSFLRELEEFQNERDAINLQYDYCVKKLESLQKTNVYNDVFCISHNGQFGTINDLKLGRLPSQSVEWDEINAAWGLILLLLHSVANKLDFKFTGYKLYPLGSTSKIDKLEFYNDPSLPPKITRLELHSSDDLPITKFFIHRKFDAAMIAFLKCLKQLGDHLEATDPQFIFPYRIHKDKVGSTSICISFNQDEKWTRALKYLLTNIKYLLAYVTSNFIQDL
ncbi:hypothetical protein PCANB_001495 [Pneumocystis canis]|nr:hypothetical protein PCK1_001517 [Pneumocystis canis]KAG5439196.1 hypothetical protein PCANB_001495 [Pneumocystis canis]